MKCDTPRAPNQQPHKAHPRDSKPLIQSKGSRASKLALAFILIHFSTSTHAALSESRNFDYDLSSEAQHRLLQLSEPSYPGLGYLHFGVQNQLNVGLIDIQNAETGSSLRSPLGLQNIIALWAHIRLPYDLSAGLRLPSLILQQASSIGQKLPAPGATAFGAAEVRVAHRYLLPTVEVTEYVLDLELLSTAKLTTGALSRDAYAGSGSPELFLESLIQTEIMGVRPYLGLNLGLRSATETLEVAQGTYWSMVTGAHYQLKPDLTVGGELGTRFDTFLGSPRAQWRAVAAWEEPSSGTWTFGLGSGLHDAPGNPLLLVHAGWSGGLDSFTDRDDDTLLAIEDACPDQAEDFDDFEDGDGCPDEDNDQDGIPDTEDQCPLEPEDLDGIQDQDGCFEDDADEDQFPDDKDACPLKAEDFDQFEDEDGCPELDNDEDGFPDDADTCPLEPEDIDEFQDQDGCPEPDNDEDGVLDADDECPNAEGPADGTPPGCPAEETIQVKDDQVTVETVEGKERLGDVVFFAYGRIHLKRSARPILNQLVKLLQRDATIERLKIVGHTDSSGTDDANQKLSQWRADAVKSYLVKRGIAAERVEALGIGAAEPIASNATKDGRIQNRRVEFILIRTETEEGSKKASSDPIQDEINKLVGSPAD